MRILLSFFLSLIFLRPFAQTIQYYPYQNERSLAYTMIRLASDDLLMVHSNACPTLNLIEGCPYGSYIQRTNAVGDTLWKRNMSSSYSHILKDIHENQDGSISIYENAKIWGTCLGLMAGGFVPIHPEITLHQVDPLGQWDSIKTIQPFDCGYGPVSAAHLPMSDKKVLFGYYDEYVSASPRVPVTFVLANDNEVIQQSSNPSVGILYLKLVSHSEDKFYGLYYNFDNTDANLTLSSFNNSGEILSSVVHSNLGFLGSIRKVIERTNGELLALFDDYGASPRMSRLVCFTATGQFLWQKEFQDVHFYMDFDENMDGEIAFAYSDAPDLQQGEIAVIRMDSIGNIIQPWRYNMYPERPSVNTILFEDDGSFNIFGHSSCCLTDSIPDPERTFLFSADFTTSSTDQFFVGDNPIIYPNPADKNIGVSGLNSGEEYTIRLYDISGKLVLNKENLVASSLIDIATIKAGIYIASIQFSDKVLTEKVVISH